MSCCFFSFWADDESWAEIIASWLRSLFSTMWIRDFVLLETESCSASPDSHAPVLEARNHVFESMMSMPPLKQHRIWRSLTFHVASGYWLAFSWRWEAIIAAVASIFMSPSSALLTFICCTWPTPRNSRDRVRFPSIHSDRWDKRTVSGPSWKVGATSSSKCKQIDKDQYR